MEYRTRYACHCVGRRPLGSQKCKHCKFIENFEKDGTPETQALMRYFKERCKSETTMSYIERTDKCVHCKRAKQEGRGVAKADD